MSKDQVNIESRLLTEVEAARYLGIGASTFRKHRRALLDAGMTMLKLGRSRRYDRKSLDRMITRAARRGEPLVENANDKEMQHG